MYSVSIKPRPSGKIDILVPFHGKYELVTNCVEGVSRCTPNQKFNLHLIDDGSPNKEFIHLITRGVATGTQLPEQTGFASALAEGFNFTSSPWVVFMHSDCCPNNIYWLLNMQRTMEKLKTSGVKLVSARSNNAGTCESYHPALFSDGPSEDIIVDSAIPLFCSLVHRDLFKKIGGFLKPYPYAWYEDEELFWRMKYYKYKQAICGNAFVNHIGGATIKELWSKNPKTKAIMESNRETCLKDIAPYYRKAK